MIPLGYMAKRVFARMDWLEAPQVSRICSVSSCISEDFGKWIDITLSRKAYRKSGIVKSLPPFYKSRLRMI